MGTIKILLYSSIFKTRANANVIIVFILIHHSIHLSHHSTCLTQCHDHRLVVADIFPCESTSLTILEPLLCWLIPSDIKFPSHKRNITEVLICVDIHSSIRIYYLLDFTCPCHWECRDILLHPRRLQEVQCAQLSTECDERVKSCAISRIWYAWEVDLQELPVLLSITR